MNSFTAVAVVIVVVCFSTASGSCAASLFGLENFQDASVHQLRIWVQKSAQFKFDKRCFEVKKRKTKKKMKDEPQPLLELIKEKSQLELKGGVKRFSKSKSLSSWFVMLRSGTVGTMDL